MWIDIVALIVLIGFAIAGARMGGTRQLVRLGAAIVAVIFAPVVATMLSGPIGSTFPTLPLIVIKGISLICGSVLIYLTITLIGRLVTDVIIRASTVLTTIDHAVGFGLGLVTASILLLIIGQGLLAMQPSLQDLALDESRYLAIVRDIPIRSLLHLAHIESRLL